ncbi:alpha/beta hydrolase [Pseudomonas oryzihabitans]|uniref:alpha/beta fold hydrolase n=1 Tax=Pseudomonas oryzihabitans TaxID=47885 RepID=UPI002895CBCE|nr:alpha/beta hydrolase [Pseudomonas oryzihabitans]MDT3721261.1 alpha/beta hydrolase [Pseudomonas oryzihabitans]
MSPLRLLSLILLLSLTSLAAQAREWRITAPDGVELAVQEQGDPHGVPIIFIHGLLGSRLNWGAQLASPALSRFRLITYDLRGHGLSGKPFGAAPYREGRRWADDLATVIAATGAQRPVLVGWSLGATVITNYLAAYGDADLAGVVYVDGVIELSSAQIVPHPEVYRDLVSPDLRTHLDAIRTFLALCFATPPAPALFQRLYATAAMASWDMQRAVQGQDVAAVQGLGRMRVPLWLLYGEKDALVHPEASIARARALNPRLEATRYAASGHAPFLEEAPLFNRDLAAFVDRLEHPSP